MSRRLLILVIIAATLTATLAGGGRAMAQATGERVLLTPAEGTLATRFTFVGSGYVAGHVVTVRFLPPDGIERRYRDTDGVEFVWLVGTDGGFSLDVVPALRFPGAPAGHWRVLFCASSSATCQLIEFDISP